MGDLAQFLTRVGVRKGEVSGGIMLIHSFGRLRTVEDEEAKRLTDNNVSVSRESILGS